MARVNEGEQVNRYCPVCGTYTWHHVHTTSSENVAENQCDECGNRHQENV
jgi:ribosomal protein L44E